jgi:hypothetical protein
LIRTAERDKQFARRVTETSRRVGAFKKNNARMLKINATKPPSPATIEKLTRNLWEFGEQVRLAPLSRAEDVRSRA